MTTTAPRSEGPSVQEYLDRDSRPVPETLRYSRNDQVDPADIPIERYISADFARLETSVARAHLVNLVREAPGLLPGIETRALVDIDSLLRPVYGPAKQGASFGHTKIAGTAFLRRGRRADPGPRRFGLRQQFRGRRRPRGRGPVLPDLQRNSALDRAIASIGEDAWRAVNYPGAVLDPDTGSGNRTFVGAMVLRHSGRYQAAGL